MKKWMSMGLLAACVSGAASAAGAYEGIYQYGGSSSYWSVHQNGATLIAAEFGTVPATGITVTSTSGAIVRPNRLDVWELLTGPLNGSTAQLTGESIYGACSQSATAVFDGAGNVKTTITAMVNTTLGTSLSINCTAVMQQIGATTGLTRSFKRVF